MNKERENAIVLTQGGLERLNQLISQTEQRLRELSKWLPDAPALSPAHEEYYLESIKLKKLIETRGNARIVNNDEAARLGIGLHFKIMDVSTGKVEEYEITTPFESNPSQKIISYQSPLAKSIIGHKEEEIVELSTPEGQKKLKILSIAINPHSQ